MTCLIYHILYAYADVIMNRVTAYVRTRPSASNKKQTPLHEAVDEDESCFERKIARVNEKTGEVKLRAHSLQGGEKTFQFDGFEILNINNMSRSIILNIGLS